MLYYIINRNVISHEGTEEGRVKLYSFLTSEQDEVICQRQAPAAIFPGMARDALWVGRAQVRLRLVRNILPPSGLYPRTV
jgi:hypothetical protein